MTPLAQAHPDALRRELFAFAGEHLAMAVISADLARTCAEIEDTAGVDYHVRRTVAYLNAVVPTVRDLRGGKET